MFSIEVVSSLQQTLRQRLLGFSSDFWSKTKQRWWKQSATAISQTRRCFKVLCTFYVQSPSPTSFLFLSLSLKLQRQTTKWNAPVPLVKWQISEFEPCWKYSVMWMSEHKTQEYLDRARLAVSQRTLHMKTKCLDFPAIKWPRSSVLCTLETSTDWAG